MYLWCLTSFRPRWRLNLGFRLVCIQFGLRGPKLRLGRVVPGDHPGCSTELSDDNSGGGCALRGDGCALMRDDTGQNGDSGGDWALTDPLL